MTKRLIEAGKKECGRSLGDYVIWNRGTAGWYLLSPKFYSLLLNVLSSQSSYSNTPYNFTSSFMASSSKKVDSLSWSLSFLSPELTPSCPYRSLSDATNSLPHFHKPFVSCDWYARDFLICCVMAFWGSGLLVQVKSILWNEEFCLCLF